MKNAGTKQLYYFEELSDNAKEKAREWFREGNDDPFMQSHMCNLTAEALNEAGYTVNQSGMQDIDVRYSLSNSQGDGFSFMGHIHKDGKTYHITQSSNHYYHEMTMDAVEVTDDGDIDAPEVLEECRKIAREMESRGYEHIEWLNSNEYVDETIIANEYTFDIDGVRMNADK